MGVGGVGGRVSGLDYGDGAGLGGADEPDDAVAQCPIDGCGTEEAHEARSSFRLFLHELGESAKDLAAPGALSATLRSFVAPEPVHPIAPPPVVGAEAPLLPPGVTGPAVLKVLRHAGCPFAAEDRDHIIAAARENPDKTFVAVVHGDPDVALEWFGDVSDLPNLVVQPDPENAYHSAWGLAPTSRGYFSGPEGLLATARQMGKPPGHRLDTLTGNRFWPAATAAIDADGRVSGLWPEHTMGRWVDMRVALQAAGRSG